MKYVVLQVLLALANLTGSPTISWAISGSQTDDFEDGTKQGWTDGLGGNNVVNITAGGPLGTNDNFLQISSGSFGGASRLITFNDTQWIGNYTAAGVTQIAMDLKNFSGGTLPIRIAIREGTGGSGTPGYSSTNPFNLLADGQWHHAVFPLSLMTPINGPLPLSTDLASVADFRLLSSTVP